VLSHGSASVAAVLQASPEAGQKSLFTTFAVQEMRLRHTIDAGSLRPPVVLDLVPRYEERGMIADQVEEVVKPLRLVLLRPPVQLPLDMEYPLSRLGEAWPRNVAIQRHISSFQ
jgi:hypothetical protein